MRFDRFDLNLLVALDILLEEKSVSTAARRLNLSQPAVTGALNRLREFFADELLFQSGRRMLLTPKAEELIDPVRRALMQIRAEITRPGDFDPATSSRRFTIVASDYGFTTLLAKVLARVSREAPGISAEIMAPSARTGDMLDRAEIDLFITVSKVLVAEHPSEALFDDHFVVVCWQDAGYGVIDVETFYGAGHVVPLFGNDRQLAIADAFVEELGRPRRVDLLVPSFGAIPQSIVGTRRLALVHSLYAAHFAERYPLALHPSPLPIPPLTEVMQWHHIRDRDPGVVWLRSIMREEAEILRGGEPMTQADMAVTG